MKKLLLTVALVLSAVNIFGASNRLTPEEQSRYHYLVGLGGHAYRTPAQQLEFEELSYISAYNATRSDAKRMAELAAKEDKTPTEQKEYADLYSRYRPSR